MKIALAADHAGYEQLEDLADFLVSLGHQPQIFGAKELKKEDDYPDFILPASKAVSEGKCDLGIVIGGSGQGEAMAANKIKGIRCAVFYGPAVPRRVINAEGQTSHDPYSIIRLSREHNDANMLSLAARFVSPAEMKDVIKVWLETKFSDDLRHQRRIDKFNNLGS